MQAMEQISAQSHSMQATLNSVKRQSGYLKLPYLIHLRDGELSREDFVETQIQFFFAVVFFSRPMAALAGRMPRPELRRALLENIQDEHGSGDLALSHEQTFRLLLNRLGVTETTIASRSLWPEVRAFNTALAGLGVLDDIRTGMAAFGIIEDMFASIAGHIGQSIVRRGFLSEKDLIHYTAHEDLDVEHAEGFYRDLRESYESNPQHRYQVDQGLQLGCYIFTQLYRGLWENRARRLTREWRGAHSMADGWQ